MIPCFALYLLTCVKVGLFWLSIRYDKPLEIKKGAPVGAPALKPSYRVKITTMEASRMKPTIPSLIVGIQFQGGPYGGPNG